MLVTLISPAFLSLTYWSTEENINAVASVEVASLLHKSSTVIKVPVELLSVGNLI